MAEMTLYGNKVTAHAGGDRQVTIDGTTYLAAFDFSRGQYVVSTRTPTSIDGQMKIMRLQERFWSDEVDSPGDALTKGVIKLKPQVEYRLREINGEDHLAPDEAVDQAIELEQIAREAAESEALQDHEAWGAWG